jgi:hypothetical protein
VVSSVPLGLWPVEKTIAKQKPRDLEVALTVGFISMASLCGELADTLPSGMMSFGQLP